MISSISILNNTRKINAEFRSDLLVDLHLDQPLSLGDRESCLKIFRHKLSKGKKGKPEDTHSNNLYALLKYSTNNNNNNNNNSPIVDQKRPITINYAGNNTQKFRVVRIT